MAIQCEKGDLVIASKYLKEGMKADERFQFTDEVVEANHYRYGMELVFFKEHGLYAADSIIEIVGKASTVKGNYAACTGCGHAQMAHEKGGCRMTVNHGTLEKGACDCKAFPAEDGKEEDR